MELLKCTKCKTGKPGDADHFPPNAKKKNGLDSWCRSCRASYRSETRRGRYRHAISDEELKSLLETKECVICGASCDRLAVDHCHKTGAVRGVLCMNCNTGLGKFKDDPMLLEFAIQYLLVSRDEPVWSGYESIVAS